MKVWKRGGVRAEIQGDELVIFIDADKLVGAEEFDVPEVELLRISKKDAASTMRKFWKDVQAEFARFNKRRTAGAKPKKGSK